MLLNIIYDPNRNQIDTPRPHQFSKTSEARWDVLIHIQTCLSRANGNSRSWHITYRRESPVVRSTFTNVDEATVQKGPKMGQRQRMEPSPLLEVALWAESNVSHCSADIRTTKSQYVPCSPAIRGRGRSAPPEYVNSRCRWALPNPPTIS